MAPPTPNPIIRGFAPDPSVCLIGDTFFLANSSFHIFPGIPIYKSRDLASWTHIGNAINRPSQLSLLHATTNLHPGDDGNTIIATGGLYAPTIRHHKGVTYILCTNVVHSSADSPGDERNFIIHTTDIYSGKWSDPVYYDFRGIDPSIFFDDDGKVYIQGTSNSFIIHNMEVDLSTGKLLKKPRVIWMGWGKPWTDGAVQHDREGWYTEGPHVYKRDGWYYLLCAEGGTFNYHMLTMARSRSVWGPYKSCPKNPVWTAYGTSNYVQHTGHADLFQDLQSRWWAVMLGVRRKGDRYVMGRESFLTPVEWPQGGWPAVHPVMPDIDGALHGSHTSRVVDEGVDWVYLRDPELDRYVVGRGGNVSVRASAIDLRSSEQTVSFIGKRQRLIEGAARVTLCVSGQGLDESNLQAGLAMYKDELRFLSVSYDYSARRVVLYAQNTARKYYKKVEVEVGSTDDLDFRFRCTERVYEVFFKTAAGQRWTSVGDIDTLEMTGFDFTGPLIGMFAIGPEAVAHFQGFEVDAELT